MLQWELDSLLNNSFVLNVWSTYAVLAPAPKLLFSVLHNDFIYWLWLWFNSLWKHDNLGAFMNWMEGPIIKISGIMVSMETAKGLA